MKKIPLFSEIGREWIEYQQPKLRTNASLRLENDENIKYIQPQVDHASPTVTLNVYAILMNPTNQEAACRLENAVFGTTGHKMVTKAKKGPRSQTVTP